MSKNLKPYEIYRSVIDVYGETGFKNSLKTGQNGLFLHRPELHIGLGKTLQLGISKQDIPAV